MNTTYDLKFIRSAIEPVTKAGVITANFNWKNANIIAGIVPQGLASNTPFIIKCVIGFPTNPPTLSPKARL